MGVMFYKDSNGVLIPLVGSSLPARETSLVTTTSLANNASWEGIIELAAGYRLLRISTDQTARVRIYDSIEHRTADFSRLIGIDPTGTHGVILDLVTIISNLSWWLNPVVDGYTADATDSVPILITNLSGSTDTVTVTFTWVRSE